MAIIQNGKACWVSAQVEQYLGNPGSTLIPDAQFNSIPGGPQYFPNGMLVRNSAGTVAIIQNGQACWISAAVEQFLGNPSSTLIPDAQFNSIPGGPQYLPQGIAPNDTLWRLDSSNNLWYMHPGGAWLELNLQSLVPQPYPGDSGANEGYGFAAGYDLRISIGSWTLAQHVSVNWAVGMDLGTTALAKFNAYVQQVVAASPFNAVVVSGSFVGGLSHGPVPAAYDAKGEAVRYTPVPVTVTDPLTGKVNFINPQTLLFGTSGPSYLTCNKEPRATAGCWRAWRRWRPGTPSDIENMFTYDGTAVENGSPVGLYTVRFFNNGGVARVRQRGYGIARRRQLCTTDPVNGVLWVALAEKAYAEANGVGFVTTSNVGSRLLRRLH